jgi:hypothetical protein
MRRSSVLLAGVLFLMTGCASVPRTVTYQTIEWREIEEAQPALQRVVQDVVPVGQGETEIARPLEETVVQANIPKEFPPAKPGRKYHKIGGPNAFNPNRVPKPGEVRFILSRDAYAIVDDRNNKRWEAWLRAGTPTFGVPTSDPNYYRVTWVEECGNNVHNPDNIAIHIRVKRETVPQVARSKSVSTLRIEAVPQSPIKRLVPVAVERTRELTCRERKAEVSWWRKGLSYAATGIGGVGGALIGGKIGGSDGIKIGAGIGVVTGRLIGGYTDGSECVDGSDVTEAVLLGVTAGMIAPTNNRPPASPVSHSLPSNGSGGNGGYAPPVNPVSGHSLPFN